MIEIFPDSAVCLAATELARRRYEPVLLNHSLRSFVFADAVGRQSGRQFNRELLYVACLLHDLGLTHDAPVQTRFEVEGADEAQQLLRRCGVGETEQELVWDAIALHTTSVIPQRKCAEIALCQLGTAIDVGFAPITLVAADVVAATLLSLPRLDFKRALVESLCGLAKRNPAAASLSSAAADAAERCLPGFARSNLCDVVAGAQFSE